MGEYLVGATAVETESGEGVDELHGGLAVAGDRDHEGFVFENWALPQTMGQMGQH